MSIFINTSLYLLYSLLKQKSRYRSDSPSLKEEHSSYNDVPMKVIKKVMKNGYFYIILGKKGPGKQNIISGIAYSQGVAGAFYFRALCCLQSCCWEGLKYPTENMPPLSAVTLSN